MKKTALPVMIPDEAIIQKIYFIRNQKVLLDRDIAKLYNVETKRLKEAVRRNISRFPIDFMFEMTPAEFEYWRTQIASSNQDKYGLRHPPFCFTEHGVVMLAGILNSERAIEMNIQIVRIFNRMKEMLLTNKDILLKLEQLEKQVLQNSGDVELIFKTLRQLLSQPKEKGNQIGFKIGKK